jgi:acetolactate synthase-1/2/3 large subunit
MLSTNDAFLLEVGVVEKGMVYPMTPAGETITNMLLDRENGKS